MSRTIDHRDPALQEKRSGGQHMFIAKSIMQESPESQHPQVACYWLDVW